MDTVEDDEVLAPPAVFYSNQAHYPMPIHLLAFQLDATTVPMPLLHLTDAHLSGYSIITDDDASSLY